ncbi:VCBS repeat-containing protein [Algoriphagus chordae]|nr:VCBS repeat-containing protein [Algoriphagus chordae]
MIKPEESGIDFENKIESTPELNILEYLYFYNGAGVAAGDINNDGLADLYFGGNQVSNKLYLNRGDFKFEDITEKAGVTGEKGWTTGVTMVDVNGDGLLDIYVSQVGGYKGIQGKNKLYINQGDETFVDEAEIYGLAFEGLSTQAAFFDFDQDGDLDMYLLNHSVKSPEVFAPAKARNNTDPQGDKLFMNLASQGENRFEDVTEQAGIYSSMLGFGLGIGISDINGDGWVDIYVSNDFTENDYLYLNQQNGTFKESLETMLSSSSRYSMGNDLADINGDGFPEIFTTDMLPEDPSIWMKSVGEDKPEVYHIKKQFGYGDQYVRNHLQLNQGDGEFSEIALFSNVFASDWSWSPLIFDMDNDGLPDIHITNGIVKRPNDLDFVQYFEEGTGKLSEKELEAKQIEMLPTVKLPNYTYRNTGNLNFLYQSQEWGLDQPSYSNGSTYADLDNDGDLDLIINNINQPAFIYQNHSDSTNNFLRIDLSEDSNNVFAIGAKVKLYAAEMSWSQTLSATRGFLSGPSTTLVFGLGKTEKIDSIEVNWPESKTERFYDFTANEHLNLRRGTGSETHLATIAKSDNHETSPSILWNHQENAVPEHIKREYLLPRSFSEMGPALAVADVNSDGLEDIFVGGAVGQASSIFLQGSDGSFIEAANPIFQLLARAEDTAAAFADFNGDGNLDLYIGSGGQEFLSGTLFLNDRLFFGDGKGSFSFDPNALPQHAENTSTIAVNDIDNDGDLDIFVGSSVVFGDYGAAPKSSLLINLGQGKFQDVTKEWFGAEINLGMINSAVWADLTGNGQAELVLSGDWQGIRVFENKTGKSLQEKELPGLEYSSGWIQSLVIADVNGDGRPDILTGNLGLNTKLKASMEKPLWLYHSDFDENGQADPLIFHYMGERLVPLASRDELIKQIPGIKRKHNSYQNYSEITGPTDLFTAESLANASKQAAYEFRSGVYFQEEDGSFAFEPFPDQAQLSPIFAILWEESQKTVLLGGNFSGFRVDLGINTASAFTAYRWKDGAWETKAFQDSIPSKAEIRQLSKITVNKKPFSIGASNSGPLYWINLD